MTSVSVVLPTYNRAYCLRRALDSVERQTFTTWELLVVDDGSTDHTTVVFEEWLKARTGKQKVRYLKTSNQGVAAARNLGAREAQAEWLAFLDSDDEWLPEKLARQAPLTREFSLIHGEEIWIRGGVRVNPMAKHKKFGGEVFEKCLAMCFISPSTVVMARNLFESLGGFDSDFPVCEDYDLWLRVSARQPVGFVTDPLIKKFGGHADQLSRQFHSMNFYRAKALSKILKQVTPSRQIVVAEAIVHKCERLERGYRKHANLEPLNQIEAWALAARSCLTQVQSTHSVAERLPRGEAKATLYGSV